MGKIVNKEDTYRYERKIFLSTYERKDIETLLKIHPFFFKEIYYPRFINNIYFDFKNFKNFKDNIVGNVNRLKYRIRWYGDLFGNINNSNLELKIRKGTVGTKKHFKLNSFSFTKGINASEISNFIKGSQNLDKPIQIKMELQQPVIINRYKRSYFESTDKKFRITIDDSQEFYKVNKFNNSFLNKVKDKDSLIIEIKYNLKDDALAKQIINKLPFRLTKSSKYSRAIEFFYI